MIIKDILSTDLVSIHENTTLKETYLMHERYRQEHYPVVDANNNLLGMISSKDLLRAFYPDLTAEETMLPGIEITLKKICSRHLDPIRVFMNINIIGVYPWTPIEQVGIYILVHQLAVVPVVENGKLLGVVWPRTVFMELMRLSMRENPFASSTQTMFVENYAGTTIKDERTGYRPSIKIWRNRQVLRGEHRIYPRIDLRIGIHYRLANTDVKLGIDKEGLVYSYNISAGGLMLEFEEKLPEGLLFYANFRLHESDVVIESLCRICWSVQSAHPGIFYAGIAFLAIGTKERLWIDQLVAKHLK